MGVFDGKSPAGRNKIIAFVVLGVLAIGSLIYTFGPSLFGGSSSKSNVGVPATPSPTASRNGNAPQNNQAQIDAPIEDEIYSAYTLTPILFTPLGGNLGGIGGRNIFAFYEPGKPTPIPPATPGTPTPEIEIATPPPPTPHPIQLSFVSPQSKYAGEKGFKIQATGDKFTPEAKIVFNGTSLQTTFINEQKLSANVPANFIASAGFGQITVDTFDGKNYSQAVQFNIQAQPKPTVEYVGMIARRHYNNDTAYFEKKGSEEQEPIGKRLNDVVDGRFKVVSISEKAVELEDTRLGFRHTLAMKRPDPSTFKDDSSTRPTRRNRRRTRRRTTRRPTTTRRPRSTRRQSIPGIPDSIPRATPRRRQNKPNPNSNVKRP